MLRLLLLLPLLFLLPACVAFAEDDTPPELTGLALWRFPEDHQHREAVFHFWLKEPPEGVSVALEIFRDSSGRYQEHSRIGPADLLKLNDGVDAPALREAGCIISPTYLRITESCLDEFDPETLGHVPSQAQLEHDPDLAEARLARDGWAGTFIASPSQYAVRLRYSTPPVSYDDGVASVHSFSDRSCIELQHHTYYPPERSSVSNPYAKVCPEWEGSKYPPRPTRKPIPTQPPVTRPPTPTPFPPGTLPPWLATPLPTPTFVYTPMPDSGNPYDVNRDGFIDIDELVEVILDYRHGRPWR